MLSNQRLLAMQYPVAVIGTGTNTDTRLSDAAVVALQQAELIIGAEHQLKAVETYLHDVNCQRLPYPTPLAKLEALLAEHCQHRIVMLASGDPLFFGIGAWLGRKLGADQLQFFANISSVQTAFSRIGKAWQNAQIVSLHGRHLTSLRSQLQNHRLYGLLTDHISTPQCIAAELIQQGYDQSQLWVCEDLGGFEEQISHYLVSQLAHSKTRFNPLNVVIVETAGLQPALPEFPGIADSAFETGAEPGRGMLSKREVRLNILSLLQPTAKDIGWDIGAGCGGVAIEWARWNPLGKVHAIEFHDQRLPHLYTNADKFGVGQNLNIIEGMAPAALIDLPDPNAIFVGGGSCGASYGSAANGQGGLADILKLAWARLLPGGRLVCAAVTEDTRMELHQFSTSLSESDANNAQWLEIAVSKGEKLAGRLILRPQLPVMLVRFIKPIKTKTGNDQGNSE